MHEGTLAELIADLADAGTSGRTPTGLVRRVSQALTGHLDVVGVEIGWCDAGGVSAETAQARLEAGRWQVLEGRRRLRRTRTGAVLAAGAPLGKGISAADSCSDEVEARAAGADAIVVLPLSSADGPSGYVTAWARGSVALSGEHLLLLARVLRAAHGTCGVIGRVASLSRRAHVKNSELRLEVARLRDERALVVKSAAMRALVERLDAVAGHDTTVLLLGESGTGKSLLARRVHARSPRSERPFVAVNCGALPEGLVESELFGHEQGSFTGATHARRGRFQQAEGGTLFLDEVGELSPAAQVKLLRVLQEGELEPVGAERTLRVDVRIVAATNRPLERLVREGQFREDLFYRLSAFPLRVPPLRERAEDLPELAAAILKELSARLQGSRPRLSRRDVQALLAHPWPGNVRELANTLERAAILSRGNALDLSGVGAAALVPRSIPSAPAPQSFAEASRACLSAALRATKGKLYGADGAAALLELKPSTLQTKMRKLGLRRADFVD